MGFSEDIIKKQWDDKYLSLTILSKRKFKSELERRLARFDVNDEIGRRRETNKSDRKLNTYLEKKKEDYDKLCKKEIDNIEKTQKEERKPKNNRIPRHNRILNDLLKLMQYYSRLRDTDQRGQGVCISCGAKVHGSRCHGGHYISRMYKSVCIRVENINLQCPDCNFATGPGAGSDPDKAKRITKNYRANLIKKVGLETVIDLELERDRELKNPAGVSNSTDFIKEQIVTYTDLCKELRKGKLVRS